MRIQDLTVPHPHSPHKKSVEDVSFDLRKGEILGIAGLVGSGRSEMLEAIFGVRKKDKGTVTIDGKKIDISSPGNAIDKGIGFLTEERKLNGIVPTMDVRENMTLSILELISKYSFINTKRELAFAEKYSAKLSIKTPSLSQSIINLSGGNQQKAILSKWLLTNLKILFLDEPTKGIDVGAKAEIYKIMNDLTRDGLSIVLISSELPELVAMCDRILILREGSLVREFEGTEAKESPIMHSISFG
jgi:D-xylose transport system ATP-binding protein